MKTKLVKDLKEAIKLSGLSDGMTISFHHHLRNGDMVAVMVLDVISELGIRDLNVNISSIFDTHAPFIEYIRDGVITGIETDYMGGVVGRAVSEGILDKPVIFRTHGGRPSDIISGVSPIDVAFIAAPTADPMGNCTGKYGKSACGSLGYAFADAMYAKTSVVITDNLVDYPLTDFSIAEDYIDYVVCVDKIGEPSGIVSGTTKITKDPVGLVIADYAARAIEASGLLVDGFSFQTGAGGASLAAAKYLQDIMLARSIKGSYGLGGITSYMVDMMKSGCFKALLDVQCFDLGAVESIRTNPNHREVSASHYASPSAASSAVDSLDVVILGATEIDTNFNVNVHTDSNGYIMGGSGGHSDTAAGAKMSMIVAPLSRARLPIVVDEVLCKSTPGSTVDVLVTQRGIAVNPLRPELSKRFAESGLPVVDIRELRDAAEKRSGKAKKPTLGDKEVAKILYRDGTLLDTIYNVPVK
ncbi:citrate lyase subunit alpha [Emergencia sp. 1XD21-10]|uniref:citrate lyase subunit alpha n=1 Tax=Emergencia sp. 1XD21-10 TaxID=2304569 RepID=UPI001379D2B1|nr:citrate lyase subunit alpha [Emergencia sp. 1XD21-10]NCE99731.1 citrate lyase subunit alpha [Emergencia sp. 1XD21-10]